MSCKGPEVVNVQEIQGEGCKGTPVPVGLVRVKQLTGSIALLVHTPITNRPVATEASDLKTEYLIVCITFPSTLS